ncbi:MAG: endonuclease/exonuclease/phosphatase family protein [Prevotella sp.]|nr:endonuclease/exonuclease/phosphatase family protein [Prevotella sp.]
MIKQLKNFTLNLIAGANVAVVVLMLLVGYSDHLHPGSHPWMSCAGMVFPFAVLANLLFVPFWVFFSAKRLLIPIIGFALAYVPIHIYLPLHFGQEEAPPGALRIVSYNVAGYGGNFKYEHALDTIMGYFKRVQPDIVCTQEDMTSKWHNTQKRYAEVFAYNDTVHVSKPGSHLTNSVGLHTRFPILRRERIDYESKTNGSVAWFLLIEGDTVIVLNNHLENTHLSNKDRESYQKMLKGGVSRDTVKRETTLLIDKLGEAMVYRSRHADIIHQYVEDHRRYPIIVCGDFNDTPISYTRHAIAQGLTDCFVASGCGLGLSFNRKGFNFRIDHLMCSEHFTPYQCEIDAKIDVSDHYPLLCWLKMREKP